MELKLLDRQDIYSGRELAHLATGKSYEYLTRYEIVEVIRELEIPEWRRVRYVRWPGGPVISCLYIMRNYHDYWSENRERMLRLIRRHLKTLPVPPRALGEDDLTRDTNQMELDF